MQVQFVAVAAVEGWNHEGLSIHLKTDMSQKTGIQDGVNGFGLVRAAVGQSAKFGASGQIHVFTRVSIAIQFTSQVFPPSSENDCSKRQEFGVMSEIRKRTKIARPLNVS